MRIIRVIFNHPSIDITDGSLIDRWGSYLYCVNSNPTLPGGEMKSNYAGVLVC